MFTTKEIKARLRQKPFVPLRIIASEGLRYDIHHPDLVLVGERDLMIGSPSSEDPTIYNRVTRVAMVHVVALEELPASVASPGNGQP